jgi:mono/diheme cytochrome c family protein
LKEKKMRAPTTGIALGIVFGATLAIVSPSAAEGTAAIDVPALWKKNCASCHGDDGKGQTKAGRTKKVEDLTNPEIRAKFDRDRMIKVTKEGIKDDAGKERMKPYADKLSDAEIAALTDYIFETLK